MPKARKLKLKTRITTDMRKITPSFTFSANLYGRMAGARSCDEEEMMWQTLAQSSEIRRIMEIGLEIT